METVAWVGAIETAIAILYAALVGQRSIAQWLDDRRKKKSTAEIDASEDEKRPSAATPNAQPRQRRLLSIQSVGDYVEYVWRDPPGATLITAKALTIGIALISGTCTLLFLLGALVVALVSGAVGSNQLYNASGQIAQAGGAAAAMLAISVFIGGFVIMGVNALADERKSEKERQEREERAKAQRAERARLAKTRDASGSR